MLSLFLLIACNKEVRPLQLAPLFTDHMVLQQQKKVAVWGTGEPGAQIKIISSWGPGSPVPSWCSDKDYFQLG